MASVNKQLFYCALSIVLLVSIPKFVLAQTALPPFKVVQLGDSYSSGTGARSATGSRNYYGVSGCYRSPTNWGNQFVDSLRDVFSVTYVNRACHGGVVPDILNPREMDSISASAVGGAPCPTTTKYPDEEYWECTPTVYTRKIKPQIDAIDDSVDLVVMTGGGNDVHFATIVTQCFATGVRDPQSCLDAVQFAYDRLNNGIVRQDLLTTFKELRKKLRPDARIVFVTYPYLVPDVDYRLTEWGKTYAAGDDIRTVGLMGDVEQKAAVDAANADAGEDYIVIYDGTKDLFEGHLPNPFQSEDRNPDGWLHEFVTTKLSESYHYNALGHQNLGSALSVFDTFGAAGGVFNTQADIDVAFIVDTTGSMGGEIAQVRANIASLVAQLASTTNSYRVAIVSYRDHPSRTGSSIDYPARVDQAFTSDIVEIQAAIDSLTANGGGDWPETVFSGIDAAIKLPWRPGVTKVALVIGDASALSPEPISNITTSQIVADSIAVDPVQVFGVDVGSLDSNGALTQISDGTGGAVVPGTYALTETISEILNLAANQPYAWIGAAYSGKIGVPVQFDASGSFDPSGFALTLYEWDFDADGIYDFQSLQPLASHTYSQEFDDFVVLRVTGPGGTAMASARTVVNSQGYASQGDEEPCELDTNGYSIIVDADGRFIPCAADSMPTEDKPGVTEGSNLQPIADAGPDQQILLGVEAILDGSASDDPDNNPSPLTYSWEQTGGPSVSLTGADTPTPSFIPSEVGAYTFALTVSDGDLSAADSVTINVVYDFTGFFTPVENPGVWNAAKSGSAVPLKFSLNGNQGLSILLGGSPTSRQIACDNSSASDVAEKTETAGKSGLKYHRGSDTYKYIWKTSKSWKGTCRMLEVTLDDHTIHKALFNFSK